VVTLSWRESPYGLLARDTDWVDGEGSVAVAGREVGYCRYNMDAPRRAVFLYGTPGTRRLSGQLIEAARNADYELLVFDRPGYAASSRRPGRRVVDVVEDVLAVTGTLGWSRFAVWGGSGGAPHALAVAAVLPDRVTACASVVGLAPFDAPGLDWFAGMSPGNVEEFRLAARGEAAYRPLVVRLASDAMAAVEAGEPHIAADYQLPESDRAALATRQAAPDYRERMRATYLDGIDGWIDDCLAFTRPWGFDPSFITVPVSIWYGVHDVLVSRAHAEYLVATIPGASRYELRGGHLLSDDDLASIYEWLSHASE
jgi:pimeloyl-ACP methyl ester carboxylesterase